jgi:MYXO-CTERM domain-containing protein
VKRSASFFVASFLAALSLCAAPARASTGTCDVSPGDTGASELACLASIQALGANTVVTGIFKDTNGKTADQLGYGKLVDPWGGCDQANNTCNGDVSSSQGNPAVICIDSSHNFSTVAGYVNTLDWKYSNPIRMLNAHGFQGAPSDKCPSWGSQVTDGNKEGYSPWEGMVFDLGGPSNKVVLFPINDHGPQPCESVEYTVYLTDNPLSRELIDNPTTTGADPQKWNRAKLSQLFLEGWKKVRPGVDPGLTYTIEADSFSSVWSLPCGITFRYVGIIAGNDGKDLPNCNFDSYDAEIDAVAGLTEDGAGVCPDADKDNFVDCNCPTHPAVCDCNDADPAIHPGTPEACDSADLNCDGVPGGCADPQAVCYKSLCDPKCSGESQFCPAGSTCTPVGPSSICIPQDCTAGGCPPGGTCKNGLCVPACDTIVCPTGQVCEDGQCLDPCMGVQCPSPQICQQGKCAPPCACFAQDIGCSSLSGTVCDKAANMGGGACVPPACVGMTCDPGKVCNPINGVCVDICNGVMCPVGQKCVSGGGCVALCSDVKCDAGLTCNPQTGVCEDTSCNNVTCFPPQVCKLGACVDQGTGGAGGGGAGTGGTSANGGAGGLGGAPTTSTTSTGGAGGTTGDKGSCGCRVAGDPGDDAGAPIAAVAAALGLAGVIRRRRRAAR